jgi:hypothetical protein
MAKSVDLSHEEPDHRRKQQGLFNRTIVGTAGAVHRTEITARAVHQYQQAVAARAVHCTRHRRRQQGLSATRNISRQRKLSASGDSGSCHSIRRPAAESGGVERRRRKLSTARS